MPCANWQELAVELLTECQVFGDATERVVSFWTALAVYASRLSYICDRFRPDGQDLYAEFNEIVYF